MKIIFITGGVVSSLGKGVVASIISGLLSEYEIKIKLKKIDPYLNIDPGTLNPAEHGEVFVTRDGVETDLDLGHYERLGNIITTKNDYITSGVVYQNIINAERQGEYNGKTVQIVPHFCNELKKLIFQDTQNCDVLICEVGGTIGDIETSGILETLRQIKNEEEHKVINLHVSYLPYLKKVKEWKTKPTQHSVRTLLSYGIQPDLLLCRMEEKNNENWKSKISTLCGIKEKNILEALDAQTIYHAMQNYYKEGIIERINDLLSLNLILNKKNDKLNHYVEKLNNQNLLTIKVGLVGKYVNNKDSYKSLEEAIQHAAIFINKKPEIILLDSENIDLNFLKQMDCIIVAGGFGIRGVEGKMQALNFAYKNNIPVLGICFGMQLMIIDALRENTNLEEISSSEFGECKNPVIAKLDEWQKDNITIKLKNTIGGTMRLGQYPCNILKNSLAYSIYKEDVIFERHRHRYEVNNNYRKYFEKSDLIISGESSGLVEIIERKNSKFCIAVQFHPEFESTYFKPNKIFIALFEAI